MHETIRAYLKAYRESLPLVPCNGGCYVIYIGGWVGYVGCTRNYQRRLRGHELGALLGALVMRGYRLRVQFLFDGDEQSLIRQLKPAYNREVSGRPLRYYVLQ